MVGLTDKLNVTPKTSLLTLIIIKGDLFPQIWQDCGTLDIRKSRRVEILACHAAQPSRTHFSSAREPAPHLISHAVSRGSTPPKDSGMLIHSSALSGPKAAITCLLLPVLSIVCVFSQTVKGVILPIIPPPKKFPTFAKKVFNLVFFLVYLFLFFSLLAFYY